MFPDIKTCIEADYLSLENHCIGEEREAIKVKDWRFLGQLQYIYKFNCIIYNLHMKTLQSIYYDTPHFTHEKTEGQTGYLA